MKIIPCGTEHYDELFQLVLRLNADPSHHIGYFGVGETHIREAFEESSIPTAEGFRLAFENDKLVGALGVDASHDIQRVWLLGPFIDSENWQMVADQLYDAVQPVIPQGDYEYEIFCDVKNINLHEFALRHGFLARAESAIMSLLRKNYQRAAKDQVQIFDFQDSFFDSFQTLHDRVFPNTYLTAKQTVEKIDDRHRLLIAVEDGKLLGYLFGKIEDESGYVDFLAADESFRRRGIGADLLARALDWMFISPSTQSVNLTTNTDRAAAISLYNKFGFITERITRGYRKNPNV
jgi:ribosomal protein S18 acetylase RimI-like enzyme